MTGERSALTPPAAPQREPWVYHPCLLAAFPVLSLLSSNAGTAPTMEAVGPLCVSVGIVAILYWGARILVRNKHKLGALLSTCVVAFFAYGIVVDAVRRLVRSREMLGTWHIAAVLLLLIVAGGWIVILLVRTRHSFAPVTHIMNRVALAAVLIAGGSTAYGKATLRGYAPDTAWQPPAIAPVRDVDPKNDPDIYFIVLDSYARADALKRFFDYDNSAFLSELRKRGFYVADEGTSNYCFTVLCLASTLNMNYVDPAFVVPVHKLKAEGLPVSDMVRHSAVAAFLKQRGYTFVSFATGASATEIYNSDLYLSPRFGITEFSKALINLTPIRSMLNRTSFKLSYELCRERIHFTLDTVESLRRSDGPLFVLAHVIAPHSPHVLDKDGKLPVAQKGAAAAGQTDGEGMDLLGYRPLVDFRTGYCDSITFLNKRVLEIIDTIRKRSPNAVFIIQGDHGSRTINWLYSDEALEAYVADMSHIFNAYGLPGVDTSKAFWPGITPVNSFRVVLNNYFGTDFPMLDGYTYLTTPNEPDKLITLGP
ncbi:MAG: sulfatase-like hydrolase/transferase, partial [Candidatus Hydrogenedentales bacterium]